MSLLEFIVAVVVVALVSPALVAVIVGAMLNRRAEKKQFYRDKRYAAYSKFLGTVIAINKYIEEVRAIPYPHNAPRNIPKVEKLAECLGEVFLIGSVAVIIPAVEMHSLYGELEPLLYDRSTRNRGNDRPKK